MVQNMKINYMWITCKYILFIYILNFLFELFIVWRAIALLSVVALEGAAGYWYRPRPRLDCAFSVFGMGKQKTIITEYPGAPEPV